MAYPFRGGNQQGSGELPDDGRSPNQNSNHPGANDNRGGLTRRFTMNALPTLSPIGQQRRQAAGEMGMVSKRYFLSLWQALLGVGIGASRAGGGSSAARRSSTPGALTSGSAVSVNSYERPLPGQMVAVKGNGSVKSHRPDKAQEQDPFIAMLDEWISRIQQEKLHKTATATSTTMLTSRNQPVGGFGRTVSIQSSGRVDQSRERAGIRASAFSRALVAM